MNKRAEELALEIFPSTEKKWKSEFGTFHFDDTNVEHREGFIVGYEQAARETIERALAWLESNVWEHTGLDHTNLSDAFRQAMEEEQ